MGRRWCMTILPCRLTRTLGRVGLVTMMRSPYPLRLGLLRIMGFVGTSFGP
ncbi:unnamed protein product [Linum tenue]|uniref:Uncharacterized protein n=1 Tax=Linum tenue TaxID=586396 RepID=A0AAV0IDZ9_9ROSI|nr:unnamed protein product [Linum tenue]